MLEEGGVSNIGGVANISGILIGGYDARWNTTGCLLALPMSSEPRSNCPHGEESPNPPL